MKWVCAGAMLAGAIWIMCGNELMQTGPAAADTRLGLKLAIGGAALVLIGAFGLVRIIIERGRP
jgi:hypothetical protein